MKLVEMNWQPNDRQLRQFAAAAVAVALLIGWNLSTDNLTPFSSSWAVSGLIAGIGLLKPQTLRWLYVACSLVTMPIGMVVSELVLLSVFCGVFLPMGLFMRVIRRDALRLNLERKSESYWTKKHQPRNAPSYFHQF